MMVELRDDDFITRSQELTSVGLCHEVDALSGAAHEDDFLAGGGIDEPLHFFACLLVGICRTGSQRVGTTMDVRVVRTIVV